MSRLYRGTLYHRRHTPTQHSFQYSVFMPFVDLDALPELVADIPFWSAQRFALAQFRRADFLGDPTQPLVSEVRRKILEETGQSHEGKIFCSLTGAILATKTILLPVIFVLISKISCALSLPR